MITKIRIYNKTIKIDTIRNYDKLIRILGKRSVEIRHNDNVIWDDIIYYRNVEFWCSSSTKEVIVVEKLKEKQNSQAIQFIVKDTKEVIKIDDIVALMNMTNNYKIPIDNIVVSKSYEFNLLNRDTVSIFINRE